MKAKAYLVGFVDTTAEPPVLHSAQVCSKPATGVTSELRRAFPVDIAHAVGDTYENAEGHLNDVINTFYAWVKPLMGGR